MFYDLFDDFFANFINSFHKNEVQTGISRCLMGLNLNKFHFKLVFKCKSCACKYVLDCKRHEKEPDVKSFTCKKVETWKIHYYQNSMKRLYKNNYANIQIKLN